MNLTLHRGCEQRASLVGPRALIDRVALASGLVSRECVDDRLRAIDHASEPVLLDALATAGVEPVTPTCALCASMRRGKCAAHRGVLAPRGAVLYLAAEVRS